MSEQRIVRPPDPTFERGLPPRTGRYSSSQAMRLLAHCYFRDAHTALDLTFGAGVFWKGSRPPGLDVVGNNPDPTSRAELHLDFTSTGLEDGAFDLVVYDPPHLEDLGEATFMRARYGTASGDGFRTMVEGGVAEAWRLARVGVVVKLVDGPHGGRYRQLTRWAERIIPEPPIFELHTIGRPTPRPAGEVSRVPRGNDATWLVFRRDGQDGRYPDFIRQYERQMSRMGLGPKCSMCDSQMPDGRRSIAKTCSDACRQRSSRQRRAS